ncbi:Pycsar system effector family protein [Streptomyces parvulus]|uniref:Pycsar system effector family protein n=1 Tax=Streptomyces parvulus TaxID=146923 RepID=A0ABV5D9W1_9ACTN
MADDADTGCVSRPSDRADVPQLAHADRLLGEVREEIVRADAKAATLLSAAGVVVGVFLAGALAGQWSPRSLTVPAQTVWWLSAGVGTGGVALLGLAVMPVVTSSQRAAESAQATPLPPGARFFGDVVALTDVSELREAVAIQAEDPLTRSLHQLWELSHVVQRKYWRIRAGLMGLACALAGFAGVLGLQSIFG